MKSRKINVITMGCSKNLVDSEHVLKMLSDAGFDASHDAEDFKGGSVVINTCGFIGDAKEESINTILSACDAKSKGLIDKVYVMGCLSERYKDILPNEIPEVDGWFGKFDWKGVVNTISGQFREQYGNPWDRQITTPSHHAYLKIAEGCNRMCGFCAIPLITGRYRSRPIHEIIEEVKDLVKKGVKEFNVIAQDLSNYGRDLGGAMSPSPLARLLEDMSAIEGVEWIRLHYAYPAGFPFDILPIIASKPNICNYLDIALQHIDDTVLNNMHRNIDAEATKALLERIRTEVPGIHIRTTLMVGFPGEDDDAFERLVEFVKEQRFDRMGAFAYCEEEDTRAAREFRDDISEQIKKTRLDKLMAVQEEIALELNEAKIGSEMKVIIDSENDDFYVGRSEFDSPEVDPEILIKKDRKLHIGDFYNVKITNAFPFELVGEVCDDK